MSEGRLEKLRVFDHRMHGIDGMGGCMFLEVFSRRLSWEMYFEVMRWRCFLFCVFLGGFLSRSAFAIGGAEGCTGVIVDGEPYLVFTVTESKRNQFQNVQLFFMVRGEWIRVRSYDIFGDADENGNMQIWCDIGYDEVQDSLVSRGIEIGRPEFDRMIRQGVSLRTSKLFEDGRPVGDGETESVGFVVVPEGLMKAGDDAE
jgi:hypothetical protein